MLTGVLVVAFPVSVFSDLWSQELKRAKEQQLIERARRRTAALILQRGLQQVRNKEDENKATTDEEKNQTGVTFKLQESPMAPDEPSSSSMGDLLEPITRRVSGIHLPDSNHDGSDDELDTQHIVMDRSDLQEIANCLHAIRTNERRVNNILEKYGMVGHENQVNNANHS